LKEEENHLRTEINNLKLRVNEVNRIQKELIPYNEKIKENRDRVLELTEKYNPIKKKKEEFEYNLKEIQKKHFNLNHENDKMTLTMNRLVNQKTEFEEKINEEKKKIENINK